MSVEASIEHAQHTRCMCTAAPSGVWARLTQLFTGTATSGTREIVDAQGGMDGPEKKEKKKTINQFFGSGIRQSRRTIALSRLTLSIIGSNELSILKWGCRTETDLARLREAEGDERTCYI